MVCGIYPVGEKSESAVVVLGELIQASAGERGVKRFGSQPHRLAPAGLRRTVGSSRGPGGVVGLLLVAASGEQLLLEGGVVLRVVDGVPLPDVGEDAFPGFKGLRSAVLAVSCRYGNRRAEQARSARRGSIGARMRFCADGERGRGGSRTVRGLCAIDHRKPSVTCCSLCRHMCGVVCPLPGRSGRFRTHCS